jgi:hypothetical protein
MSCRGLAFVVVVVRYLSVFFASDAGEGNTDEDEAGISPTLVFLEADLSLMLSYVFSSMLCENAAGSMRRLFRASFKTPRSFFLGGWPAKIKIK